MDLCNTLPSIAAVENLNYATGVITRMDGNLVEPVVKVSAIKSTFTGATPINENF